MHLKYGVDALIADIAPDFARQVVRLYTDEQLWAQLANIEKHFSFAATTDAIKRILG